MILRMLPILLLTVALPDLYLYLTRLRRCRRWWLTSLALLPSLLLLGCAGWLSFTEDFSEKNLSQIIVFYNLFLLVAIPKIVFLAVDLLGKGVSLLFKRLAKICRAMSVLVTACVFFIMLYGIYRGPSQLTVRHAEFYSDRLPKAFDGYRIVQFSDFHLTSFRGREAEVAHIMEKIMEQEADMIAFTGDLVSSDAGEMKGFETALGALKARDGVFSVMGNHDYATYARFLTRREQRESRVALQRKQRECGWDLLLNEHRIIRRGNDSIVVGGVENDGKPPFPERGDLKRTFEGLDTLSAPFKILLSHDPSHWRRKVLPETDVALTLSGHTHGMQFMIGGWSPSAWIYPEWKHLYEENGRGLYVSLGIGGALIPFRFGAWPEINVITLHGKK
jgi:predicted MPP superfamily phosphohydrolase